MPTTLTGSDAFVASITAPADGDAADAASVNDALQDLIDNDVHLKTNEIDFINWNKELANSGNNIAVGAMQAIRVGGKLFGSQGSTSFTPASAAPNTRYYVYAFNNSGSLAFESITTAPNEDRLHKFADATRLYLGTYLTDGSGNVMPFRMVQGKYRYRFTGNTAANLAAINGGVATVFTDVPCAAFVPSWAQNVSVHVKTILGGSGDILHLRTGGDSGDFQWDSAGSLKGPHVIDWIELSAAQKLQYKVEAGGGGTTVYIYVLGWQE